MAGESGRLRWCRQTRVCPQPGLQRALNRQTHVLGLIAFYMTISCRFLEEFQQQHTHACSDGSLKARWLSINTDTAQVGTRIRQDSPDFDAPFSSQIASSPAQNSHTTPAENGVHGQQAANRSENPPHLQKQSSTFPVPLGPLGAPINDFSRAAKPRNAGLVCHTGLSPMHAGMSLEDAGVPFEVSVPSLNFSARNCDIAQGPWRSFLVLLSEDASFFESENLWPNFLCHRGRTLHNITCTHAVRFLADPCVSEVSCCYIDLCCG